MQPQLLGDATQGTGTPTFLANATDFTGPLANQTLHWAAPTAGWDGFSLLVDDVERYVGDALNYSLGGLQAGIPHFFRIAVSVVRLHGARSRSLIDAQFTSAGGDGDYTLAGTLLPNGTWVDPLAGAS
jgi:hypothetical protein